jgi:cupin fold WbuC family metalloprotein
MSDIRFMNTQTLDEISLQAKRSPRLRKNFNFHTSDDALCHRLLNAMEPGSYIQPHRHLDPNKDETLIVIRGRMGLILFDIIGQIQERVLLELRDHAMMVNIPHGTYHTWVSLEERSVFFESKAGPYRPLTQEEKAPWAPVEGDPSATTYLASLKGLFETDRERPCSII